MPDGWCSRRSAGASRTLSVADRVVKIIDAGFDQFGGEALPEVLVELVRSGRIAGGADRRVRAPAAARQVPARAVRRPVRRPRRGRADRAARRVPRGRRAGAAPLRCARQERRRAAAVAGPRIYVDGVAYDGSVERPEDADVAIVRRNAPFEPRTNGIFEAMFHAGDLDFEPPELGALLDLARRRRPSRPPSRAPAR